MPPLRKYVVEYFTFTRKERTGIVVVLLLIGLLTFLPVFFPFFIHKKQYEHRQFEEEIAALQLQQQDSLSFPLRRSENRSSFQPPEGNYYSKTPAGELFYFDPNTLPPEGWKRLGLRDKAIHTIQNYVSKGGRFRQPEDIGKIWGLHEDEVNRLLPYVRIVEEDRGERKETTGLVPGKPSGRPARTIAPIDINTADTTLFIALPGIGSKLATRIISFREKLGGFYKVEQVSETYGLPDSTFQKIKDRLEIGSAAVKQLNINTASADDLKTHPYIRYPIANAIVQYRNQHGEFKSVDELKKIMIITPEIFGKLEPYLSVR